MVVTETTRIRVSPNVHAREFDGELILVDLQGGDYFGLDEIGGRIWSELAKGATPAEIASAMIGEYDIDQPTLLHDILALLTQLADRKLVEVRNTEER
jgi:hypothetical protein